MFDMIDTDPGRADFLNGRLLIAMPGISDPRFQHAVILVCIHSAEHAMGVRVNTPLDGTTVGGILGKLGVDGAPRDPHQLVLSGGPVERERGFVLHSDDFEVEGSSMPVAEGLALTATREVLETLTEPHVLPRRALLVLGYAGWGPGQLEAELRDNTWLACPADLDLVFDEDHDAKWARALAKMGVSAGALSSQAGRA